MGHLPVFPPIDNANSRPHVRYPLLLAAVFIVLGLQEITGYPDALEVPPSTLAILAVLLVSVAGAVTWLRARGRMVAVEMIGALGTLVFLFESARVTEQTESPLIWFLIFPLVWVSALQRRIHLLITLGGFALVSTSLAAIGERDELWRAPLIVVSAAALAFWWHRTAFFLRRASTEREETNRLLARAVLDIDNARASERQLLTGEIHDYSLQQLMAALMQLRTIQQMIGEHEAASATLQQTIDLTRDSIDALRRTLKGLEPHSVSEADVQESLGELSRVLGSAYGVEITVAADGLPRLDRAMRPRVYRIVGETIANAARHANADAVSVDLQVHDQVLVAVTSDDGDGFRRKVEIRDTVPPGAGMGWQLLVEQVRELGGTVLLQSEPGKGTTVRIEAPLKEGNQP